jgi:hypothetical protein
MFDLFKNELLRFRTWAIAALLVHLAVLGFFGRMVDPLQQPTLVYQVVATVYGTLGLLLGLYQMGSYRRPSTWLYLIHRPLPPARVATALASAAAAVLLLAIALPVLALIAGQLALSARVVDARHWGLPLAAVLVAVIGYLAGANAMLAPRRRAAFVLVLPLLLFAGGGAGLAAIAGQLAVLAWLALLLRAQFKADLSSLPGSGLQQVIVASPLLVGAYGLLVMASLGYQLVWMMLGSHPLNSTPPAGGFLEASRADGQTRVLAGVADGAHPELALWREQVRLSEVHGLGVQIEGFPVRHQLTNPAPLEFDDEARQLRWIFSHDTLRFAGVSLVDRRRDGALGLGAGDAAFAQPMLPLGEGLMVAPDGVYAYDSETREVARRVQLPAGETLASLPSPAGESRVVLSDRALYFYNARALAEDVAPAPTGRLPLPGAIGDLADVDVVELLDGHLVSFLFGRASIDGPGRSWQDVWWLREDGRAERIGGRTLGQDFPLALRHYAWWLSPLMAEAPAALAKPDPLKQREPVHRPTAVRWLAAAMLLASALAALWWQRGRRDLTRGQRLAWVTACAALGPPAAVAFWLQHPPAAAPEPSPVPTASPSFA